MVRERTINPEGVNEMNEKQETMTLKVLRALTTNHNTAMLKVSMSLHPNHNQTALPVRKGDDQDPQPNESVLKEQTETSDAQYQTTLKFDKSLIRKHNETTLKIK
jgi:hypothetical protein